MLFHTKSETYSLIKLQLTAHAAPNPLDTDGVLLTYVQSIDYNSIFTLDKWLYLTITTSRPVVPNKLGWAKMTILETVVISASSRIENYIPC
jgi:hypothetical protein